jgi:aryl-alcohol dehydrogenase-like predicted oxidoreductase
MAQRLAPKTFGAKKIQRNGIIKQHARMSSHIPHVAVGGLGLISPRIALGTMGMTAFYNQQPSETESESLRTMSAALDLGVNHLDTAWIYRNHSTGHHNEELVAKALSAHGRERFTVATKFFPLAMTGGASEHNIRQQLTESLQRLGTSYVDLYYMHRVCEQVTSQAAVVKSRDRKSGAS